jgi:hypothetical protein
MRVGSAEIANCDELLKVKLVAVPSLIRVITASSSRELRVFCGRFVSVDLRIYCTEPSFVHKL